MSADIPARSGRGGGEISNDLLAARDAARAGHITRAEYEALAGGFHQELDVLHAESRRQQDQAVARYQADREADG
jgi:hypothetical protein